MTSLQIRAKALLELRKREKEKAAMLPQDWQAWLHYMFPTMFSREFATHHIEFWEWVEAIQLGRKQTPFIAIWPRGGGKTSSVESAIVRLAAKETRKFCLYVRSTQDKANESVVNIATMLESNKIARHYPRLSERKMSKYGFARGWRVDMLRCANGFSVIGLGLDAAVRGVKIEEQRPDIIALDDIDSRNDSMATIEKKINTITTSILPAGANDVTVLGVQNLIHEDSIFASLANGKAEFLYDREISGPFPAVKGLEYEEREAGGYTITAGEPTWTGQDLKTCEKQINEWGLTAFLREAQHDVEQVGGLWQHITFQHCDFDQVPDIVKGAVWVDPAVTTTDNSDSMGIIADGLGIDGKLYRLFAWEKVTTPEKALERAILKALELGFTTVGIETDQGGDTWRPTYKWVWEHMVQEGKVRSSATMPQYTFAKAGAGHGSKVARNQRMLVDYEHGKVVHVRGTHDALERSLKRFPKKPLDLADAAYWGWYDLMDKQVYGGSAASVQQEVRTQPPTEHSSRTLPETANLLYLGQRSFPMSVGKYSWYVRPGWKKEVELELAQQIEHKFPKYFRVERIENG